jgi:hypothetical protein
MDEVVPKASGEAAAAMAAAAQAAAEAAAANGPMFGVLDIVLLAGMAGFGIYWVYFRGSPKAQPPPNKGYTMQ